MRVYYPGGLKNHTVFVTPAADPRAIAGGVDSSWLDEFGEPKLIAIDFVHGVAEVADALARYLFATKQAKRTRLWLPRSQAA